MKIRTHILSILLFICLNCFRPVNGFAQLLVNTSWRPIDNLAIALKNQGVDTLTIKFLPDNKMQFSYNDGSSTDTSYGLWWQLAPGYFKFQDTSNSGVSGLCDADDEAYVQYTIDTNVMHFANMQDSCAIRGTLFTDSKWAMVGNSLAIMESRKTGPDFQIYPNPGAGSLHIVFNGYGAESFNIQLYDLNGQVVLSFKDISANDPELIIPPLPAGTYLARIESPAGIHVISKVLIQQ